MVCLIHGRLQGELYLLNIVDTLRLFYSFTVNILGHKVMLSYGVRRDKCQPHLEGFAIKHNPPYSGSNNRKTPYKCRSSSVRYGAGRGGFSLCDPAVTPARGQLFAVPPRPV